MALSTFKAVIIDDNQVLRMQLRDLLHRLYPNIEVHTADNGVEGLGLVYVIKPDLIFIDTTLPKYGGMEVMEYLVTNVDLKSSNTKVLVLSETSDMNVDPSKYALINKRSPQFVELVQEACRIFLPIDPVPQNGRWARLANYLAGGAMAWANRADLVMHGVYKPRRFKLIWFPMWMWWLVTQLMTTLAFFVYSLGFRRYPDSNIDQQRKDLLYYRTRYYPTLVGFLTSFMFVALQVGLFVGGGIIIFSNIKVNSVFANYATSVDVDFKLVEYDARYIENSANGYQLAEFDPSADTEPGSLPGSINAEPNATSAVLGATTTVQYFTTHPAITFVQALDFSQVYSLREQSNRISFANSQDFAEIDKSLPELISAHGHLITYQLSPDLAKWYYLNEDTQWQQTDAGWIGSNTVQQINLGLANYSSQVGGDKVYLRAFLHSDGVKPTILQKLQWERELQVVSTFTSPVTPSFTPMQEPKVGLAELQAGAALPSPLTVSFTRTASTSSVWGLIPGLQLNPGEADSFNVEIFTANSSIKTPVKLTSTGDAYFEFPNISESLTKVAVRTNFTGTQAKASNVWEMDRPGFVVTTTNDIPDSVNDGWCRSSESGCSLRAAISEANSLGGEYQIDFSLAVSDPGYRDYNLVSVANSGDGEDADDLWVIDLTQPLPQITASVAIAGSKVLGVNRPEVQINGGGSVGTIFSIGNAGKVAVNNVALVGFTNSGIEVSGSAEEVVVSDSTIGIDALQISKSGTAWQNYGLNLTSTANVQQLKVSNSRFTGNSMSQIQLAGAVNHFSLVNSILGLSSSNEPISASGNGLIVAASATVNGSRISENTFAGFGYTSLTYGVRWDSLLASSEWCGNSFGMIGNRTVSGIQAVGFAIFNGAVNSKIGGEACTNYFGGHKFGLQLSPGGNNFTDFRVDSNVFGTDAARTAKLPNQIGLYLNGGTGSHSNTLIANNLFKSNGFSVRDAETNVLNGAISVVEGARGIVIASNQIEENTNGLTFHNANSGELPPGDNAANQAIVNANTFQRNQQAIRLVGSSVAMSENKFIANQLDLKLETYTDGIRTWLSQPIIDTQEINSETVQ